MSTKLYSFSKGLKKARKKKGIKQKDLANKMNMSIETVRNWEQGRNVPEMDTIIKLCEYFECDIDYLFNRLENKTHDLQFVCDYTGLTEEAVRALHYQNKATNRIEMLKTLSYLIEQSYQERTELYEGPMLLFDICQFLQLKATNASVGYYEDGTVLLVDEKSETVGEMKTSLKQYGNYVTSIDLLWGQVIIESITRGLHETKHDMIERKTYDKK